MASLYFDNMRIALLSTRFQIIGSCIRAALHHVDRIQGTDPNAIFIANAHMLNDLQKIIGGFLPYNVDWSCFHGGTDTLVAFLRMALTVFKHGHWLSRLSHPCLPLPPLLPSPAPPPIHPTVGPSPVSLSEQAIDFLARLSAFPIP